MDRLEEIVCRIHAGVRRPRLRRAARTDLRLLDPPPRNGGRPDGQLGTVVRGIFICYRRDDSQGEAGRIDDHLRPRYGSTRVFRDVCSTPIGTDLHEHLVRTVTGCSVVIVVIGRHWLESLVSRLHKADDWLRIEIRTALRCPAVTVIPVLVQGAPMPAPAELPDDVRAIATIAAHELSDSRWDYDMDRLIAVLDELVQPVPGPALARRRPGPQGRRADTSRAFTAAWAAAIVFTSGMGVGLIPAIVAARGQLPPELYLTSLAGAVLLLAGAVAAGVDLLFRQAPLLRFVALGLLIVGMMLVSMGAGAALRPGPPGPPGEPPGERHGEPPPGAPARGTPGGPHGPPFLIRP